MLKNFPGTGVGMWETSMWREGFGEAYNDTGKRTSGG